MGIRIFLITLGLIVLGVWGVVGYEYVQLKASENQSSTNSSIPVINESDRSQNPVQNPAVTMNTKATDTKAQANSTPAASIAVNSSSKNSGYIYHLSEDKIREAIANGKDCLLDCDEPFTLPNTYSPYKSEYESKEVISATIDTPYNIILGASGLSYYKKDKVMPYDEAFKLLDDENLNFSVSFYEGFANMYAITLIQGNNAIEASLVAVDKINGAYKMVNVPVSKIDFTKPATLRVVDKEKTNIHVDFGIDFKKYVR